MSLASNACGNNCHCKNCTHSYIFAKKKIKWKEKNFVCKQEWLKVEKWNFTRTSTDSKRCMLYLIHTLEFSSEEKHSWMNWTRFGSNLIAILHPQKKIFHWIRSSHRKEKEENLSDNITSTWMLEKKPDPFHYSFNIPDSSRAIYILSV